MKRKCSVSVDERKSLPNKGKKWRKKNNQRMKISLFKKTTTANNPIFNELNKKRTGSTQDVLEKELLEQLCKKLHI